MKSKWMTLHKRFQGLMTLATVGKYKDRISLRLSDTLAAVREQGSKSPGQSAKGPCIAHHCPTQLIIPKSCLRPDQLEAWKPGSLGSLGSQEKHGSDMELRGTWGQGARVLRGIYLASAARDSGASKSHSLPAIPTTHSPTHPQVKPPSCQTPMEATPAHR